MGKEEAYYPEAIYKFVEDAKACGVPSLKPEEISSSVLPGWLDPQAIKSGSSFASRHFFLVFFSHFVSLLLLLTYVPVRRILLKTGRSHTKPLALRRYLSTLSHVKLWYEGDLAKISSPAVRDVQKVRQIHAGVSQRILTLPGSRLSTDLHDNPRGQQIIKTLASLNDDENNNNNRLSREEEVISPITQLDMMVTQYCFMGLLTSFPSKFGVEEDLEGLEGFKHIWAVIGYLLGIEDKYNLCLIENDKQVKEFILREVLLPDLFSVREESYRLWEALVQAMSEFVPCLSINAALLFILDHTLMIRNTDKLCDDKCASNYDRFCYQLMITLFMYGFRVALIESVFNGLLRLAIYLMGLRLNFIKMIICVR